MNKKELTDTTEKVMGKIERDLAALETNSAKSVQYRMPQDFWRTGQGKTLLALSAIMGIVVSFTLSSVAANWLPQVAGSLELTVLLIFANIFMVILFGFSLSTLCWVFFPRWFQKIMAVDDAMWCRVLRVVAWSMLISGAFCFGLFWYWEFTLAPSPALTLFFAPAVAACLALCILAGLILRLRR